VREEGGDGGRRGRGAGGGIGGAGARERLGGWEKGEGEQERGRGGKRKRLGERIESGGSSKLTFLASSRNQLGSKTRHYWQTMILDCSSFQQAVFMSQYSISKGSTSRSSMLCGLAECWKYAGQKLNHPFSRTHQILLCKTITLLYE
jgi:hypothetical protein